MVGVDDEDADRGALWPHELSRFGPRGIVDPEEGQHIVRGVDQIEVADLCAPGAVVVDLVAEYGAGEVIELLRCQVASKSFLESLALRFILIFFAMRRAVRPGAERIVFRGVSRGLFPNVGVTDYRRIFMSVLLYMGPEVFFRCAGRISTIFEKIIELFTESASLGQMRLEGIESEATQSAAMRPGIEGGTQRLGLG